MAESKGERTYKATGITLKSAPMGESDRLLTILTKEYGLVRAITPGSRKPKSSLRAISTGFVVGELFIVKGRNLDKLVQADCRTFFPGLSKDLGKLTAAQYLAELALGQALSDHPQNELFDALMLHLDHIAQRSPEQTLPSLLQGILQFLTIAGIAPQVDRCCVTQVPIVPNFANPNWRVGFDASVGGTIIKQEALTEPSDARITVAESSGHYIVKPLAAFPPLSKPIRHQPIPQPILKKKTVPQIQLDATELTVLQHLSQVSHDDNPEGFCASLPKRMFQDAEALADQSVQAAQGDQGIVETDITTNVWLSLERTLRYYAQYHFDQPIRSASLIETCFLKSMAN